MRLLVISPHQPSFPGAGSTARLYCLMRALSPRHELRLLVCPGFGGELPQADRGDFWTITTLSPGPPSRALGDRLRRRWHRWSEPRLVRCLRPYLGTLEPELAHTLQEFRPHHVVLLHTLLAALIPAAWLRGYPVTVDVHEIGYRLQAQALRRATGWRERLELAWEYLLTRRWEARLRGLGYRFVAVSRDDARELRRTQGSPVSVVPNGVDTGYFAPAPPGDPYHLLFVGNLEYPPNVDAVSYFVARIWPALQRLEPRVRLQVVGRRPPPRLRELAAQTGFELEGEVADVRPYLAQAGIVVVPLRSGSGTRLKILEALSCGRCVVSTTRGAEGLEVRAGEHLLLADEPEAFVEGIRELWRRPELGRSLAQAGSAWVRRTCDWGVIAPLLEAALASGRAPGAPGIGQEAPEPAP